MLRIVEVRGFKYVVLKKSVKYERVWNIENKKTRYVLNFNI